MWCIDIGGNILSDQRGWILVDEKWVACTYSWCWYGQSETYFEKDRVIKERAACFYGSLLCRYDFKLVFESNKYVMSKYGNFVGKCYESKDLFRLSL
jgi:hypothetical protein